MYKRDWFCIAIIGLVCLLGIASMVTADYTYNPFTGKLDYYSPSTSSYANITSLAKGALQRSGGRMTGPITGNKLGAFGNVTADILCVHGYINMTSGTAPSAPHPGDIRIYGTSVQGHARPAYKDEDDIEIVIGRDNFIIARNTSGGTITKGTAVYVTGSTGNVPDIAKAKADSLTTLPAIGLTMMDINNNAFGYVLKLGILTSYDTSAYSSGDRLFVAAATAGALTTTRPTYPNFAQRMGSVLVSGVGNGSIAAATAPFIGGEETGTVNDYHFGGSVNFHNNTAIDMLGGSGPVLPSHGVNKSFLHTPTGRKVLMLCEGTTWLPHSSIGSITMYVNGTSGTDSADKGFGTGTDAFATVQYAISQIPVTYDGHVYIYITAGTYREAVTIQGKVPSSTYNIYLIGTWTTMRQGTLTGGAARVSATQSAEARTGFANMTTNKYQGKMFHIYSGAGLGQYRPVLSNTSTVRVEAWTTTPDSTSKYRIYDWGTRITGADAGADTTPVRDYCVSAGAGQLNVVLQNLKLDYASATTSGGNVYLAPSSFNTTMENCEINNGTNYGILAINAGYYLRSSYVHNNTSNNLRDSSSTGFIYDTWFKTATNCVSKLYANPMLFYRCRIDGGSTNGIQQMRTASIAFQGGTDRCSVVNSGVGILITQNSIPISATVNYFYGNTTDYTIYCPPASGFVGTATLSGGTVTVSNTNVTTNSLILVSEMPGGANLGDIRVSTITAGTSFVISSTNVLDSSPVAWQILTQ